MKAVVKKLIYSYYVHLAISLIILLIVVDSLFGDNKVASGLLLPLLAAILSFVFFVQKQKLDEARLFNDLFNQFNRRYNDLEPKLLALVSTSGPEIVDYGECLSRYFSLCAEEYYYHTKGLIPDDVWSTWCKGIEDYLRHAAIRRYFQENVKPASHYGFSEANVMQGAKLW